MIPDRLKRTDSKGQESLAISNPDGTSIGSVGSGSLNVTGTINTTESVTMVLSGISVVGISLTGGFGGNVVFEASIDGVNWFTQNVFSIPSNGLQQSAGNAGNFTAIVGGFAQFRVRGNTVSNGPCTVAMQGTVGGNGLVANNNPLNVNVQNFAIGQFGNQDNTAANLTSSMQWAGMFAYDGTQWPRLRTPNVFKPVNLGAGTSETTIWTPTSGKKFRLMGFLLTCGTGSTLTFKDNTAGSTIFSARGGTDQPIPCPPLGNGILSAAANNVLTVTRGTSCTLDGTVWGTEE